MLYRDNTEPMVEDLLTDPIAHLLMSGDGLEVETVWAHIEDARKKLHRRKWMQATMATSTPPLTDITQCGMDPEYPFPCGYTLPDTWFA